MRELNWKPEQFIEMTVLGDASHAVSANSVRLLELAGKRLHLMSPVPLPAGTAVRLESDGQLVLGEVLDSGPAGAWIEIRHMLLDAAELSWQKQGWQR